MYLFYRQHNKQHKSQPVMYNHVYYRAGNETDNETLRTNGNKEKHTKNELLCSYCGAQDHLDNNCLQKFLQHIPSEQRQQQGLASLECDR